MLYCLFDYYPARMAVLWLIGINVFGSARRSITLLLALFFFVQAGFCGGYIFNRNNEDICFGNLFQSALF